VTRLRTGGGDNAVMLGKLPNLDLGDTESPAEELEDGDEATGLLCHNEMDRVLSGIAWASKIFARRSFAKLGMRGDPGGDETGLGIGGNCVLSVLDKGCSVGAGNTCPCVA
jgi:hypothetical protein